MSSERLQRILTQTQIIGKDILDTVPIKECNEPLVDVSKIAPNIIIKMSKIRREYAGNDILFARESVCQMLSNVFQALLPNYRLVLMDAYRPIAYQRQRYEQVYRSIKENNPHKPDDVINQLVFQVVFPPDDDPKTPPPHATGGAVDVALATPDGVLIDCGSSPGIYNDKENARHVTNSIYVSEFQRANRLTLLEAMVEAGFCNYPGEWWHFMYGDREYASYEGFPYAIYGRADLIM